MKISEELQSRGFIHQNTGTSLAAVLDDDVRTIYHGIDPSADSAHVGNFVIWMLLRQLAKNGHKIVFLVGGGTGMIGDPKPDAERTLVEESEIQARVAKIKQQAETIFSSLPVTFVDNSTWLRDLSLIDFLRTTGKHFTVAELIKKEAIAKRLASDTGLSYTEFAYPLLQAFDYLKLFETYGVSLQVGGSDQWGNMVAGVDLVRRIHKAEVHALTVPLIIDKTTGKKFGKSEGNAVWLSPQKTTPYQFYQFWFNVTDENVIDYLKLFTDYTLDEIKVIGQSHEVDPGARLAQQKLALAVTEIVHGGDTASAVAKVSACLFGDVAISDLSTNEQQLLLDNAPVIKVGDGEELVNVLVASALSTSKREARLFIEQGAITVQGKKETDVKSVLTRASHGSLLHLKRGKKQVAIISLI